MAVNLDHFSRAMTAALQGPEVKKIKPERHEFNVKPIAFERFATGLKIIGTDGHHISHHLRFRSDDQVFYRATLDSAGDVQGHLDINIKSTWTRLDGVVGFVDGLRMTKADTPFLAPAPGTEALLDGSWEAEARFLIANIVAHAAVKHLPRTATPAFRPGRFIVTDHLLR